MQNKKSFWKEWGMLIIMFSVTIIVSAFLLLFVKCPLVVGSSMEPTYYDGDRVVVMQSDKYIIGDVVVLDSDELDEYIIKRVEGVAGDNIKITRYGFFRNDQKIYESYINSQFWIQWNDDIEITVPEGQIFVMGDNRSNSKDSRLLGCFNTNAVTGKVIFKLNFWE